MQEIKGINSVLLKKRIPLTNIIGTDVFVALTILPVYRYVDGKRTDEVCGFRYDVVDEIKYDRYSIKVQGEPLMSNEELQAMREHEKVMLQFENPSVYLYYSSQTKCYEDSYAADAVMYVPTTQEAKK